MPILYVHGVSVRDETGWQQIETLLRRYIAPVISADPENVSIKYCFWGDQASSLSWLGSSIPDSPSRIAIKRLKELSKERLSNFCTAAIQEDRWFNAQEKALWAVAADDVIHSEETMDLLSKCKSIEEEAQLLQARVKQRFEQLKDELTNKLDQSKLLPGKIAERSKQVKEKIVEQISTSTKKVKEGIDDKIANRNRIAHDFAGHLLEGLARGVFGPTFAATRVAMEMRLPVNQFVSRFLGDVFTYLYRRGDSTSPGAIPKCVLELLVECKNIQKERGNEPIVVLSHSMGGQIMYDLVTHFLPSMPEFEDVKIDFWCASASQVGFFEELKLFLESSHDFGAKASNLVPFPNKKHLGYWWNVWDHNDFVSYSAKGVIDGVDDESYNTGMDIVGAHVGYLVLPSFYRKFALKIERAKANGFKK